MFESSISHALFLAQNAANAEEAVPFYETGIFMFISILVMLAASWFVANMVANSLRLKEYGGKMFVILTTILIASLIVWTKFPPKFGVDLKGAKFAGGARFAFGLSGGASDEIGVFLEADEPVETRFCRRVVR